jgi:hypothetical protein
MKINNTEIKCCIRCARNEKEYSVLSFVSPENKDRTEYYPFCVYCHNEFVDVLTDFLADG